MSNNRRITRSFSRITQQDNSQGSVLVGGHEGAGFAALRNLRENSESPSPSLSSESRSTASTKQNGNSSTSSGYPSNAFLGANYADENSLSAVTPSRSASPVQGEEEDNAGSGTSVTSASTIIGDNPGEQHEGHGTVPCFKDGCENRSKNIEGARLHFAKHHVAEYSMANNIMLTNAKLWQCRDCSRIFKLLKTGKKRSHACVPDGEAPLAAVPDVNKRESYMAANARFLTEATAAMREYCSDRARGTEGDADSQESLKALLKTTLHSPQEYRVVEIDTNAPLLNLPIAAEPPVQDEEGKMSDLLDRVRRAAKAIAQNAGGHGIRKAREALTRKEGLRVATIDNVTRLQKKYFVGPRTEGNPANAPLPADQPLFKFDSVDVRKYLNRRVDKSPDANGWTARMVLDLMDQSAECCEGVLDILSQITGGLARINDNELIDLLLTCLGHPIPKGRDGTSMRPACSVNIFLQTAVGVILAKSLPAQRAAVGDGNMGVAANAGVEVVAREVQCSLEANRDDSDFVIGLIDIENAFLALDNSAVQVSGTTIPAIAAVIEMVTNMPIKVVVRNHSTMEEFKITASNGVMQGFSAASFLYTQAQERVVDETRTECPRVNIAGFVDDTHANGKFWDFIAAFDHLASNLKAKLGLSIGNKTMDSTKCSIIAVDKAAIEADPQKMAALLERNIKLVDGAVVLGIPVGTDSFIRSHLNAEVEEIREVARDISEAAGKDEKLTRKCLVRMIRMCVPSKFMHLMRVVDPRLTRPFAKRVDRITVAATLNAAGIGHADPSHLSNDTLHDRVLLPLSKGGCGGGSCEQAVDAAYVGSWAQTCERVKVLNKSLVISPNLPCVQALQVALNRVKAAMPVDVLHASDKKAVAEIHALTLEMITEETTRGLQAKISNLIALQTQSSIITRLSVPGKEADLRVFRSCCGAKAGSWLNSSDSRFDTQMTDPEFAVTFAMRLGIEPFADVDAEYMCKRCGELMGNSCTHATLCRKGGSAGRTERHDELKHAFARAVREYDNTSRVRIEPNVVRHCKLSAKDHAKSHRCRADVLVTNAVGARIFDFVVSNAAAASAPTAAKNKSGVVAQREVQAKNRKYTTSFNGVRPGENFFACAAEAHGCLHPLFLSVLRDLIDIKDDAGLEKETPKSVHASRLYERIGVALQRGNAQGILDFRYLEIDAPETAEQDAVIGSLYSRILSLADCDVDLRIADALADGVEGALAEQVALAAVVAASGALDDDVVAGYGGLLGLGPGVDASMGV